MTKDWPFSNVQVVMARSLTAKWKQPIFYEFDTPMTGNLLKKIITAPEEKNIHVVGVISDMGPKNQRAFTDLGITLNKTFFQHPSNANTRVWVFYDVPHLIKLLRNHFLDSGLKLEDGTIIKKDVIQELLEKDAGEFKICFKMTSHHLSVSGRARQNVRVAAQLFSNRTAKALEYVLGKKEMAQFFSTINDGFDILNSRVHIHNTNKMKSSFGQDRFPYQNEILEKMKKAVLKLRVGNVKTLLPFQRGLVTSIESLRGLHRDYVNHHNGRYLLTARLNQDCLEKLFSRIRRLGGFYNHPQATEVRNRICLLILTSGNAETMISMNASVAAEITHDEPDEDNDNQDLTFMMHELFIRVEDDPEHHVMNSIVTECVTPEDSLMDGEPVVLGSDVETTFSPTCEIVDCGREALKYVAGYVAFRCINYDRTLATPTGHLPITGHDKYDWVAILSRGGLREPSTT